MIEEWRPIPGFPSYEVSSFGCVRRSMDGVTGAKAGKILKPFRSSSGKGYPTVTLCVDGKKLKRTVHALVCTVFHGNKPSDNHEVAHGNGNKLDCSKGNLRWALRFENHADKLIHGTDNRGQKHGMSKLSNEDADVIRNYPKGRGTGIFLARQFGVSDSLISMIRNGKIRDYSNPSTIEGK